jgi:hypothetical protein
MAKKEEKAFNMQLLGNNQKKRKTNS